METNKFLIALAQFNKFGPVRLKKLNKHFRNNWQAAWTANFDDLKNAYLEENIIEEFLEFRKTLDPDKILEQLDREKIKVITLDSANYPALLKEIYQPPFLLYYKGYWDSELFKFPLAIIGTRKNTDYGYQALKDLMPSLIQANLTIISGLALGIDSLAHRLTLENHGRTVAIVGSSLDNASLYPASNRQLAQKIIDNNGLLISEFPLNTPGLRHNFPRRNRLISGVSLGVLIIEACLKSGTMITANYALEQNREVFAVPGNIYSPTSQGTNEIIKQGAKPIMQANDVLEALNLDKINNYHENKKSLPESQNETIILDQLKLQTCHANELAKITKLDISQINATLIMMEMKGLIKNIGNMTYVKNQ